MLKPNTSRKLKMVSYSVTPICMHKEFFCSIVIKQVTTRLGLERKGVDDFQISAQLPDSQEYKQDKKTHEGHHSVVPSVISNKTLLGRRGKFCWSIFHLFL